MQEGLCLGSGISMVDASGTSAAAAAAPGEAKLLTDTESQMMSNTPTQ